MKDSRDTVRVNLYIAPKYLAFLDEFAADMQLSRSAAITVLIRDYQRLVDSKAMMNQGNELISKLTEISGQIDAQSGEAPLYDKLLGGKL